MLEVRAARHGDAPALDALGAAPEAGVFCIGKEWGRHRCADTSGREIFGCAVAPEWRGRGLWNLPAAPGAARRRAGAGLYSNAAGQCRDGGAAAPVRVSPTGAGIARRRKSPPAREAGAAAGPLSLPKNGCGARRTATAKRAGRGPRLFCGRMCGPALSRWTRRRATAMTHCSCAVWVGAAGRVLAFDVQPQAVENTNARLRENGCGQVGRAVLDSHANLAAYAAPGSVDAAVFNLGYLPGGDHGVFTTPGVSVPAMRTALELLRPGGVMTVCVYYGGPQGMAEKGCGAGVSHGSAAGRIPRVCARFFRPAGLSAHPRLHRKRAW